ncbi:MAG: hypothetical protein AAGI38_06740 [Bacteroidota bacterium]
MKSLVASFLLAFYLVAIFRPLWPFIEYAVNQEYIEDVFCENKARPQLACKGKCYLMKKLADSSYKTSKQEKAPLPGIQVEDFVGAHIFLAPKALPSTIELTSPSLEQRLLARKGITRIDLPPPRQA